VEIGSLDTVVQQADREPAPNGGWWCAAFAADESDRRRLARAVLADVSARDLGVLLAVEGDVLYCLLTLAMVPGWPREIGRRAGLSRVRAGLSDGTGRGLSARRASQQAGDALRLGTLDVTAFPDVELDALLGRLDGWQDFVERKLGPLLSSPELVASLDAYLRDRNVTQAAARLSVHRNTLIYRLKRCRDLLGVDVDDPRASFSLMLALHLMSAHRDRS
jgi:hypothetical protein